MDVMEGFKQGCENEYEAAMTYKGPSLTAANKPLWVEERSFEQYGGHDL